REIIADAGADNIRYLELRFSPAALKKAEDFPLAEVIDWPSRAPSAPRRQRGQPSCLKQNAPARQPCSRGSSQATGSGFRAWR
ncbi:MAG TPA: hypothetical protein VJ436_13065, partial [Anaerolineales bacterium]|nr:hypothetical protein [Anaerolineales bacterium]